MEKPLEYFDAIANAQKQAFNNLLSAQKELRLQWIDSISKSHAAFTSIPGVPETPQSKDALKQFNTWFDTVATNTQVATEEVLKSQESWICAYEKQLATNRELFKDMLEIASPVKAKSKVA